MRTEQIKNANSPPACVIFELFQVQGVCEFFRENLALDSGQLVNWPLYVALKQCLRFSKAAESSRFREPARQ
jgi:hypothetical protein